MAEQIQAITNTIFPFPRRMRAKSQFAQWLTTESANTSEPSQPPMLSMDDELLLARLREMQRPSPAHTAYARSAGLLTTKGIGEDGQYVFDFMTTPSGARVDEEI